MRSTTPDFSAITTDLITSYGLTVKHLVQAYRASGERMADLIDQGWKLAMSPSRDQLSAETRRNARVAHAVVGSVYHRSLDFTATSADVAVDKLIELASQGVAQVAANAARFDEQTGVAALDKLAQVAAPAAVVVQQLASRIEAQSSAWAEQISGEDRPAVRRRSAFVKARARRTA